MDTQGFIKMMKQKISLEISKNEKVYQLVLDPDSPLGECFDVLTQLRAYVFEKIKTESEAAKTPPTE